MAQRLTFDFDKLLFCGQLTDRKISAYQKAGYYGPVQPFQAQAIRDAKRDKIHEARKLTGKARKELLSKYD